jgi:hypothetical protein
MYKYNKDTLKENLTIEEVFDLVSELGGDCLNNNFLKLLPKNIKKYDIIIDNSKIFIIPNPFSKPIKIIFENK